MTYRSDSVSPADLERVVRNALRQMQRSITGGLTQRQVRLVEDYGRGGRYTASLLEVVEIARTAQNLADAVAFAEGLRGLILLGRQLPLTTAEAFRWEQAANHAGDLAQMEHLHTRSRGTRDAVIEAMTEQEIASRLAADAVHAERMG